LFNYQYPNTINVGVDNDSNNNVEWGRTRSIERERERIKKEIRSK
jgi:hypothetical protein